MQRYGPPPSYPNLKIAGLNGPIPEVIIFKDFRKLFFSNYRDALLDILLVGGESPQSMKWVGLFMEMYLEYIERQVM